MYMQQGDDEMWEWAVGNDLGIAIMSNLYLHKYLH